MWGLFKEEHQRFRQGQGVKSAGNIQAMTRALSGDKSEAESQETGFKLSHYKVALLFSRHAKSLKALVLTD